MKFDSGLHFLTCGATAEGLGPPFNPSNIREWTEGEFRAFVESSPVVVERFELTRSDDGGEGQTTQLVAVPSGERR